MATLADRVIVLGGSAGGLDAVAEIVARLDPDLPAAVFAVLHLGAGPAPALQQKLTKAGLLPVTFAAEGMPVEAGRLYIAPPDHHTFVQAQTIRLTRGPRVNHARPAIDLTFRSLAVDYGAQAIGVVLSGMLDDGAAGLHAIKRCGGITLVQDPADALYPDMPESALQCAEVDYTLAASDMGAFLSHLAATPAPPHRHIPAGIMLENRFDMNTTDDLPEMDDLGSQVPVSCPECGGPLWELKDKGPLRYRCHMGHSLTARNLLMCQEEEIERTLWIAFRTLEERANMQQKLARREEDGGRSTLAASYRDRERETRAHADRLRKLLLEIGAGEHPTVTG